MDFFVAVELHQAGRLVQSFVAMQEADLRCRIEMLTGIAWLDVTGLYQELADRGGDVAENTYRVANSYEKWGAWQQEVADITVRMRRL